MRLTLRTLLAYLDDILEPDDTEDIGKKVEESEFATNLVHRTRDCMRRLRLGVPGLLGRGLGADPNSVAEYLDNTLAAERVGEFEKICLESDVHLAEVAACHQILTLVLGEPAEVDAQSRERIYRIASQIDAPPVQDDSLRPVLSPRASTASGAPPVPAGVRRAKPEVPEYLRETRSSLWPLAAMVLVAAVLTFGGLMAFGPATMRDRLLSLLPGSSEPEEAAPAGEAPPNVPAESAAQPATQPPTAGPADSKAPEAIADRPVEEVTDAPPAPVAQESEPSGSDAPATPASPEPAEADARRTLPGVAATPLPPEQEPSPATIPAEEMPPDKAEPADEPARPAAADTDQEPGEVEAKAFGRYTSKQDVLLKLDADKSDWIRLAAMPLAKGDRLLSLPLFRPMVTLSSSVTLQAQGPAAWELVEWAEQDVPVIAFEFGRFLIDTVGKANNSLQLKFGDQRVQLTFVDADATLALEVHRILTPGKDPETEAAPLAVDLYARSGTIRVRDGEHTMDLQAPAAQALLSVAGHQPSAAEFPKWISSESLTGAERQGTMALEPLLVAGEPAASTLAELADWQHPLGKRREVRSLAIRGLAYLGDFEPCVKALNDPKEKLAWDDCMDELQLAVARGPETAAQVRSAFEKLRGDEALLLYRMLWGYSAAHLKNGAAKDLVDGLDKDSLDYRVMSFWNLQNIAGPAHHGYRPEDTASKRRTPYNAWKEKLRQGKIVPHASGTPKGKAAAAKGA